MKKELKNLVLIDEVKSWDKNPREISPKDFESLKKKIERWGIWKPFLVWESRKQIIGGNMRYKACKELGHKEIWVEYREPKDDAEALEMAIADNESSGEWIRTMLIEQIELNESKIDLEEYKINMGFLRASNLIGQPDSPDALYTGLQDFNSEDKEAFKRLIVNFENMEDLDNFAKLIGQKLTLKTRSIWYPEHLKEKVDTYQ